jgi:hypothetical protein
MRRALIRSGLAVAVAIFSFYAVTGAWAENKKTDTKLLVVYYHADW